MGCFWIHILVVVSLVNHVNAVTFCDSNMVNVTVEGWTVPVCEATSLCLPQQPDCSVNPSRAVTCRCDPACKVFGDCCVDYLQSCTSPVVAGEDPIKLTDAATGIEARQISCAIPPHSLASHNTTGYMMVDRCHDNWRNRITRDKCHDRPNPDDMFMLTPVTLKSQLSFKNIYCAICNRKELTDLVPWSFQADCTETPVFLVGTSPEDQARILMAECSIWYFLPLPVLATATRTCTVGLKASCDAKDGSRVRKNLEDACHSYVASSESVIDGEVYRNPHCLLCNNSNADVFGHFYVSTVPTIPPPILSTMYYPRPQPPPMATFWYWTPVFQTLHATSQSSRMATQPISILIDFTFLDETLFLEPVVCEIDEVFDSLTESCVDLSCPEGYLLINRSCILPVKRNRTQCLNQTHIPSTIDIECINEVKSYFECGPSLSITEDFLSWFQTNTTLFRNIIVDDITANMFNNSGQYYDGGTCIQIMHFSSNISIGVKFIHELHRSFSPELLDANFLNVSNCRINDVTVSIGCVEETDTACSLSSSVDDEPGNYTDTIFFKHNNLSNDGNFLYTLNLHLDDSKNVLTPNETYLICAAPRLHSCSLITLNATLFLSLDDGSVVFTPLNRTFSPTEFSFTKDGMVQVCSLWNATGSTVDVEDFLAFTSGQSIASLIGCVLSITGLVICFITYIVFASLRKSVFGKLVMSMCVSLTLSQSLLLVSGFALTNETACRYVAVFGHYLWLAVSSNSVALAVDLHQRFGFTQKIKQVSESLKVLLSYMVFVWGLPLVIVVPCFIIDLCQLENIPLTYGKATSCWVGNGFANLVVFGVPIAISLFVNGTLFLLVVLGIRKWKQPTKKGTTFKIISDLFIFLKMSTLLGFTWIIGFVAAFVGGAILLYVFIILNSLQGVYIAVAFVCNKRVFKLWREACHCGRHASGASSKPSRRRQKAASSKGSSSTAHCPLNNNPTGSRGSIPLTELSEKSVEELVKKFDT